MAEQEIFRIEGDASDAVQAIQQLLTALEKLPEIVKQINRGIGSMGTSVDKAMGKIETRVDSLNEKLEKAQQQFKDTGTSITSVSRRANTLNKNMEKQGQVYADTNKEITSTTRRAGNLGKRLAEVSEKFNQAGKSGKKATKDVESGADKAEAQVQSLTIKINILSAGLRKVGTTGSSAMQNIGKGMQIVGKGWLGVHNFIMGAVNGARMLAQGMTNAGRAMMFFVSLPIIGFLTMGSRSVIEFEDAMVRTGKTTDMWGKDLTELTHGIRELARYTATSHVELATMAEQVGQLGVRGTGNITALVDLFNKLTITTDISAESVAKSMGKLGNAFGMNLSSEQGVKSITKLSNAINRLENETAASADEIVTSMLKWAQVAHQMSITSAEAAGLSASMIALGMSEEEAGTALKNANLYMIKNIDKLQQAMQQSEKYSTMAKTRKAIDEDIVEVLLDLAEAADQAGSASEAMATLMEIGRLRGGRALMAMANNAELVRENLARANAEFRSGDSLMREYERAMTSTKNQMGILRNNITDIGMTLGETFLPILNKVIMVLIPAAQELNKWIASLDDRTKILAMGVVLLVVVLGPLLFFFGQIFHSITLLIWGFGTVIALLPKLIMGIGSLIVALSGIGPAALLIVPAIIGGLFLLLKALTGKGEEVANWFKDLAKRAVAWGEKLAANWADGFLSGAIRYITQAVATVANWIAGFFESHSPPKKGPLKGIMKWGTALMETYLKGFTLADFGILKDVAGYIEKILTMGITKDSAMIGALGGLAKARVLLSKLIDGFNKTGQIATDMLDKIVRGTGFYADKLKNMIVLQLRYKRVQEELKRIEEKRTLVNSQFEDQIMRISRGGGDIGYKVSSIRAAKRARDDELRALDKREEMLERESELLKEQIELQKAMLDALLDQEDIFVRITEIMNKPKEGGGGMGDLGGGFPEIDELGEVNELVDQIGGTFDTVRERIDGARRAFEGFLLGFRGEGMVSFKEFAGLEGLEEKVPPGRLLQEVDRRIGDNEGLYSLYQTLHEVGTKAKEVKDTIIRIYEEVVNFFSGSDGALKTLSGNITNLLGIIKETVRTVENFLKTGEWDTTKLDELIDASGLFPKGEDAGEELWNGLLSGLSGKELDLSAIISVAGSADMNADPTEFGMALNNYVMLASGKINGDTLGETFAGKIVSGLEPQKESVGDSIVSWLDGIFAGIEIPTPERSFGDTLGEAGQKLLEFLGLSSDDAKDTGSGLGEDVISGLAEGMQDVGESEDAAVDAMTALEAAARKALEADSPSQVFARIGIDAMLGLQEGLMQKIGEATQAVQNALMSWMQSMATTGRSGMYQLGFGMGQGFVEGIRAVLMAIAGRAPEPIAEYLSRIASALKIGSPSKVAEEMGMYFGQGFVMGVNRIMDDSAFAYSASNIYDQNTGVISPTIIIENPMFQNEDDMDVMVGKVKDAMADSVYRGIKYGGYTRF